MTKPSHLLRPLRRLGWLLFLGFFGCSGAGPGAPGDVPAAVGSGTKADGAGGASSAATGGRKLIVTVRPQNEPPSVNVALTAWGDPAELARWVGAASLSGANWAASDDGGDIAVDAGPEGLSLARAPTGKLSLSYRVPAAAATVGEVAELIVDPFRAEMPAERLVVVPAAWREAPIAVHVDVSPASFGAGAAAASTLGAAAIVDREITGASLERLWMVAGKDLGHAVFDGPEGHDEAAWIGYTSFDPRVAAAEVAGFRTAAGEFFGDARRIPMMLVWVGDNRAPGTFVVERRPGSVVAHLGSAQRFDGPVRVSLYHQVLAQWIGSTLWIGPTEPARADESLWFRGGVARYLSRELAFRFGLITATERRDEVEHLIEIALLPENREAEALAVARGALYATWLEGVVRARPGDATLDAVLRDLMKRAITEDGPLPTEAWIQALEPTLGAEAGESFERYVRGAQDVELAKDALGPCFRPQRRRYERFSLGFTESSSNGRRSIATVEAKGPAERAGLKVGDAINRVVVTPGRTDEDAEVEVDRNGDKKMVRYRPVGASVQGPGFARDKSVPEARCAETP